MVTATDEPVWDVDLLETRLTDKNKLADAAYPGQPQEIAWRYGRPGITADCGVAVAEFCARYMNGTVWQANPYYAVKSFSGQPLTKSLKFQDRRLTGGVQRIVGSLKKGKAVVVGLARIGPGARVALTGKRDDPLQSFHAVAIVACDKLGFYFLYLDSIPQWSSCYYKRTKYTAMGYIVPSDGLVAPSMDGQ